MTHTTLSRILISMIISLTSYTVSASDHSGKSLSEQTGKEVNNMTDHSPAGKAVPLSTETQSKVPHTEKHVPQMEELPHIHKFHKERVKKIKKHHSKYWLLSQLLLALCHISILVIGFLHATH